MTEAEWLSCAEPKALLDHHARFASQRKLRLAAAACARQGWHLLADRWSREAVETAERFVDRLADRHDFAVARAAALDAVRWAESNEHTADHRVVHATRAAAAVTMDDPERAARQAVVHSALAAGGGVGELQCALLRDVFGNPFRPVVPALSWSGRDGEIKQFARTLYEGRRFAELPGLAEALTREGCRETAVLDHCRGPGPHVRGCWVLDLLTGRT